MIFARIYLARTFAKNTTTAMTAINASTAIDFATKATAISSSFSIQKS